MYTLWDYLHNSGNFSCHRYISVKTWLLDDWKKLYTQMEILSNYWGWVKIKTIFLVEYAGNRAVWFAVSVNCGNLIMTMKCPLNHKVTWPLGMS